MRKFICSNFELDLSKLKVTDNLQNPWFSDKFFVKVSFPFEMDLSDDVMLKSYKIEIHSNFDHHSHGGNSRAVQETVDFSFNRSYDVSGQKTAHIHHHDIVIPANATAGDYHLMVYCTDAAGNESYIARNIKLSNEVEDEDHHHNE